MKKYLLSTILAVVLLGGFTADSSAVLAKSPSKHDDVVVNVSLPAQPAPAPAAQPTPIVINNTATATNNNYPVNTNTIDLDLINSIKDLVKGMSSENCQQAKSKAYPYRTSWTETSDPQMNNPKKYYYNDYSNYEWIWGPYQDSESPTNYANYDWGSQNSGNGSGTNYENVNWEAEWNKAWDDGWSAGWDTGWDDAFTYIQSDEWMKSNTNSNNGSSTTTDQSTYSI